ncbi:MAG: hypothetical protein WC321_06115 [Candidatus Omnitrophota bacterium]|jgi:hypothetical protein
MKKGIIKLIGLTPVILSAIFFFWAFSSADLIRVELGGSSSSGPRLLYPVTDNISAPAGGFLEFRWERNYLVKTRYYIFKLYKGYDTTASGLILNQQVRVDEYPFRLPAGQFADGRVYTWVLIQVFYNGKKSDKSSASFKIRIE